MTKADVYMFETIQKIEDYGFKDINPRPHYADGTPAHTISINHTYRTYDLSVGEFPICTLRPMAWKTGIREIFTIYQKPTNKIAEMEAMGVNWWGDWDIGDGTIGHICDVSGLSDMLKDDIANDPNKYYMKPMRITGMESTKDNSIRHPKFIGFRDDIDIKDCSWDKIF